MNARKAGLDREMGAGGKLWDSFEHFQTTAPKKGQVKKKFDVICNPE